MLASGIRSLDDLARRCQIPPLVIEDWLVTDGRAMLAIHAIAVQREAGVRIVWLLTGEGPVTPAINMLHGSREVELHMLLQTLSANAVTILLRYGRRLAGR